ncbi:hypothetical protein Taro_027854 [Colocasia esculenta]|uniref:Uncharacterized protein n=1 Tax=Colocasia esculenta TaxID=4460 RepID=A0A843VEZ3_COLES|nr:hypothetical protein [Colocasia esculenta]
MYLIQVRLPRTGQSLARDTKPQFVCYYTAGGTDPTPLRRGSELDDGRETSSSLSPVGGRGEPR